MPFVRRGSGYRRGMGYNPLSPTQNPFFANCAWWDAACWTGLDSLLSGGQLPQAPAVGGSVPPPTLAPGSVSPGLPAQYDPTTGLCTNCTGQTQDNPYVAIYPDLAPAPAAPGTACDWTQASWFDVTTWCGTNFLFAGIAIVGGALLLKGAFK